MFLISWVKFLWSYRHEFTAFKILIEQTHKSYEVLLIGSISETEFDQNSCCCFENERIWVHLTEILVIGPTLLLMRLRWEMRIYVRRGFSLFTLALLVLLTNFIGKILKINAVKITVWHWVQLTENRFTSIYMHLSSISIYSTVYLCRCQIPSDESFANTN